ncbi:MAG: response regulator [Haliangiales bacterium]
MLSGVRILVIEDNYDLAVNLTEILEDEGASVQLAVNASEARLKLKRGFDVALVDVNLPDADGVSLLTELKDASDGLAEVVLISGFATVESALKAVDGGAYAYILKPFRIEDIMVTMQQAWRQIRSSRHARQLARELAKREADLRALVEAVQALLIVLDKDGRMRQSNPAVTALTGMPAESILDKAWHEVFTSASGGSIPSWELIFGRLLEGDHAVSLESRVPTSVVMEERIVSWRFILVSDVADEPLVYAAGLDVTELKALERRTQLAQRLAAVGTLAAGLAHEIRNPLNAAQLQLRLLERRVRKLTDDTSVTEPMKLVQHEIHRLSNLVHEFLDFARPATLSIDEHDLVELATRVVNMERESAAARDVSITLDAAAPVKIEIDAHKIQQVLLNLLRNAIEAIDDAEVEQRRVHLEIVGTPAGAVLHVRDTGAGITEEVKARIFEPFFSTKQSGTGLGMAICHSLVTQHGGDLYIHSEIGQGADVEVHLPRHPPIAAPRARRRALV